jgi:hypothetical protein
MTDEPQLEEELAQPSGRTHRVLGIAVVVLVVLTSGFLLVRTVSQHVGSGHRMPTVASSSTHRPFVLPTHTTPPPPEFDVVIHTPPTCPSADDGQVACTTLQTVPHTFLSAVRAVLPHLNATAALTNVLRDTGPEAVVGLWSRIFSGHDGGVRIGILISRGQAGMAVTAASYGSPRRTIFVRYLRRLYTVEVKVIAPAGSAPSVSAVESLAADARLVREH